jgi:hypothetical protein
VSGTAAEANSAARSSESSPAGATAAGAAPRGGRRLRVALIAFDPFWPRLLANGLNARFGGSLHSGVVLQGSGLASILRYARALATADVIVRVGGTSDLTSRLNRWFFSAAKRRPSARFIVYWIGTDALTLTQAAQSGALTARALDALRSVHHITGADHLTAEVASAGVWAVTVPIPVAVLEPPLEVPPLPAEFRVLTYVAEGSGPRFEFYGGPQVLEAARALPHVRFTFMGADTIAEALPPNVEVVGRTKDPSREYARSAVVVRMLAHDGGGGTANEARMFGRYLIYSYAVPHAIHVPYGDVNGLVCEIDALARQHAEGALVPNVAARQWALTELDPDARFERLRRALLGV